ncbi:MAG: hypothetical protein WA324_10095 [Bryobacteraceae bacterium]
MRALDRRVVQISPVLKDAEPSRLREFLHCQGIVLLGDPGAGKSHCFEEMAKCEQAQLYTVRQFVACNGDIQGKTVYLDGLDEYRPRQSGGGSNPEIQFVQILHTIGKPRFRLSCRFADWLGPSDLELFKAYGSDVVVLGLEPLNRDEALEILAAKGTVAPQDFLKEAANRHMEWIVSNPQNLLMLVDVVAKSGWPKTKLDLYEQWNKMQLTERKEILRNSSLGHFSAETLLDAAGAICAALLISDVNGIRRTGDPTDDAPTYQSVPHANIDATLTALTRAAFVSPHPEIATYTHRTIAEYLGARWLGRQVANGLPLSRVQALLGVDSYPSSSLRGLHAWLPIFLPGEAGAVISHDPIGVLTYGDAASLKPSLKISLIKSLRAAASENVWVLNRALPNYGLAAISGPETAKELLAILKSPGETQALKHLALRAIAAGEPLTVYRPLLEGILGDLGASSLNRELAFKSLLNYGSEGESAAAHLYQTAISREVEAIRLRASMVAGLYGRPFGPTDVIKILSDTDAQSNKHFGGDLWPFSHVLIGTRHLFEILDGYEEQRRHPIGPHEYQTNFDVVMCIERMVERLCEEIPEDDILSIRRLMVLLISFYERLRISGSGGVRLSKSLSSRPSFVIKLVDLAIRNMDELGYGPSVVNVLNHATSGAITLRMMAERLFVEFDSFDTAMPFPQEMLRKYEALGRCLLSGAREEADMFARFIEIAISRPECHSILGTYTRCEVDERKFQQSPGTSREWRRQILQDRPEAAKKACRDLVFEQLRQEKDASTLLHDLLNSMTAPSRSKLALAWLKNHRVANLANLEKLCLLAAESAAGRMALLAIAEQRAFASDAGKSPENQLWIVVGFALDSKRFEAKLKEEASRETLWRVRSLTQASAQNDQVYARFLLDLHQIEFVLRLFVPLFPKTEASAAAWGDQSDADAAMYLGALITTLSSRTESAAGDCLARLLHDLVSTPYSSFIRAALSEQRELSRQTRYEKPSWDAVCTALGGGAPANVQDLKALFLAQMDDASKDICGSNLDKYRVYWNGSRHSPELPKDEEFCRDRLVEYLRERLSPLDVWVEPEGHMAADKRADIVVLGPNGVKLPVEVKRDTHKELWGAAENQLERLYTRDPGAQGYGVYLVFYFGPARGRRMTRHPDKGTLIDSVEELSKALDASVPVMHRDRISCFVLDVSPPAAPVRSGSKRKAAGEQQAQRKHTSPASKPTSGKAKKRISAFRPSAKDTAKTPKKSR